MKIVHLEDFVSNFDRLTGPEYWSEFGTCTAYERTPASLIVERAGEAEILFVNKSVMTAEIIAQLPHLRYIGEFATGYNNIDIAACAKAGIAVTNVPAYSTDDVAQLTFAHLLNLVNGVETHAQHDWSKAADFSQVLTPQRELCSMTLGIVGFGMIGRKTAQIALAFGMKVLCFTRTPAKIDLPGVQAVGFDELLQNSDVVSLHCPMSAEAALMMNGKAFAMMKKGSFFINTARGGLVDENALKAALDSGHLAGAGLDVLTVEPPAPEHPLLHHPRCRLTPHIAWTTIEARRRLLKVAKDNLKSFLNGGKLNRIV